MSFLDVFLMSPYLGDDLLILVGDKVSVAVSL